MSIKQKTKSGSTPWNVARDQDYIDISPCSTFNQSSNYKNYYIPNECKQSHICHNITDNNNGRIRSFGYQLKHVLSEFGTTRAIYIGPSCDNQVNYTIHLRFTCGNHLVSFILFFKIKTMMCEFVKYIGTSIISNCFD